MNKAEIIRKISKKAGVPDTEAKRFFELFLKDASEILKPGESLDVGGIGIFQLRVGQIENRSSQNKGEEYIYSDLIVYMNKDENLSEGKEIIFNVPSGIEKEYQPVDSYFSLSIGKPVVPLKGVKETEFFIPPSGTELRSLLESKSEKLISEAERTGGGKETETIHFNDDEAARADSDQNKTDEVDIQAENRVPNRSDFLKTREFENLSWDFGENLSDEIEEESLLDFESGEEESVPEEAAKDYKPVQESTTESSPEFEEEDGDEVKEEDIFEEVIDEDADEAVYYEDDEEERPDSIREKEEAEPEGEAAGEYEAGRAGYDTPVNQFDEERTGEKDIEQGKAEEDSMPEQEETDEPEESKVRPETEEPSLKNFQRVRSLTREFTTTEFDDIEEPGEEEKPKRVTEVRGGYQKVRRTTAEFNFDLSGIQGLDEIDEEPPVKQKKSLRDYQGYRKRSSVPSLIIAFGAIIIIAGIIFLYFKLRSENSEITENTPGKAGQTTTIDRNYDVPVTYPYDKSGENKTSDNGTASNKPSKNEAELKTAENTNTAKADLSEIREPVNARRIGNYIYQYPEGVVVQVSSWKSKTIALSEVKKYREAGYKAFAERSEIQGMGLYYRVRVGYFNSLEEAENFVNGNH